MTAQDHREVIEACHRDCARARQAIEAARAILEAADGPDQSWVIQAWLLPSQPGTVKLTLGGGLPHGRVPIEFQIKWFQALMDAAWQEIVRLRQA